jgi:Fe2+ or Zn2+ uptake regulation protein
MTERVLDEFLDVLTQSIEEKRVLRILFSYESMSAEEIAKKYEKLFSAKIGSKIYHILKSLTQSGYVVKDEKEKVFYCDRAALADAIKVKLQG